jgi:hypothetical protein
MLDQQESAQIVVDCIRAVSHVPAVDPTGTLDDAELSDGTRVNNLITLIVNSSHIGVPSRQHRINAGWFNGVEPDTAVSDVIGIVRDKSTPVLANPLDDFASLVASHLAQHLRNS